MAKLTRRAKNLARKQSQKNSLPAVTSSGLLPSVSLSSSIKAAPSAGVERRSAGSDGSMYNWIPKRLDEARLTRTRETTVARALDLTANDAHVSGLIESMDVNVVGVGYRGQSKIVADQVPMTRLEITLTQRQLEWEWKLFCRGCDIQGRKHFVDALSVADRSMLCRGEYLVLPRMVKNSGRYSLKLQIVDPLRMKTPTDKMRSDRIIDGVEIDGVGRPVAYWIHADPRHPHAATSKSFLRIPAMRGHRKNVLHGFIEKEPDQYRGEVFFAPAMKFFRDLSDLLDSEVVSNIFTSAVAMFIATADPTAAARAAAGNNAGRTADRPDIQGFDPGAVLYGRPGEEPHILEHNRPGQNFVPFVDTVLRAACTCAGIPLEVGLKRYGEMNYSSARAAILEAWRVFGYRQDWLQRHLCRPVWEMMVEEAHLRDYVDMPDFYKYREAYSESKWIAPARGQIDPVKETQSNILKLKYNMISHSDIASGEGLDWEEDVAERRATERDIATMYGLEYPDADKKGAGKENAK